MTTYYVLGLMSGTSLDGLDMAYAQLKFADEQCSYQILKAETIAYSKKWQKKLSDSILLENSELLELDISYSTYLSEQVKLFIAKHNIEKLDLISSHGHTVKHRPDLGYTLQIGNLPAFGEAFSIPVVCDFRTQDVALGGQGAPLVPIGDRLLFSEYDYCLNLGGIANISTEQNGYRIAYDIGAVNMVLNHYANKLGHPYDKGGQLAAQGKLRNELLKKLNQLPYYQQPTPKSLGREWVETQVLPILQATRWNEKDILHTYTQHITEQISLCIKEGSRVLVTGGGAYNDFLIRCLSPDIQWILPTKEVIEYKEALIFGLLGILRFRKQINCLKSYTGASKDHCSGTLYDIKH